MDLGRLARRSALSSLIIPPVPQRDVLDLLDELKFTAATESPNLLEIDLCAVTDAFAESHIHDGADIARAEIQWWPAAVVPNSSVRRATS